MERRPSNGSPEGTGPSRDRTGQCTSLTGTPGWVVENSEDPKGDAINPAVCATAQSQCHKVS